MRMLDEITKERITYLNIRLDTYQVDEDAIFSSNLMTKRYRRARPAPKFKVLKFSPFIMYTISCIQFYEIEKK